MVAEACGNRTHLARVRRHAGFEDQEGHQAQSASTSRIQEVTKTKLFCKVSLVSSVYSRHPVEHTDSAGDALGRCGVTLSFWGVFCPTIWVITRPPL
jgi:hypothetical protein